MFNQVQLVCLRCCVTPDFVVEINIFLSLALFSAVIHKRRGKKMVRKTIKYKLDSSSKLQFVFLSPEDIQKVFWKTISFVKNLKMTQIAVGGLMFFASMRTCDLPLSFILKKDLIFATVPSKDFSRFFMLVPYSL